MKIGHFSDIETLLVMQKDFLCEKCQKFFFVKNKNVKMSVEENWAFLANAGAQPYQGIILIERLK